MAGDPVIRPFREDDAGAVRDLFVAINRELAPSGQEAAFERYIERALAEEIGCIGAYYAARDGGFWVTLRDGGVVGMFGLERAGPDAFELRRMYVAPAARRGGVARSMLARAEAEARRAGAVWLVLSTSEVQEAALAFYRRAGYRLTREEVADTASNKTVGGGIRRFHFEKPLGGPGAPHQ
ncbi:GNAT family N-acetyltransferase [Limibaculum sp. M0105]|uniref:GNAT family N-acetyltransferase n=1 Tax=Thermohalobaculum xanthum TaxID=2753746 RepID=A0A8J7SID4_9RHOB|nr:GNAT family N-acetyltransferase [Thermohalobaculum xanthum]MBK0400265.1 GNAT family N-acetyltransferase [Thermohalobaculum xanthum]